ncbi:glycosyltransferase family 2 protein [Methylibium sp.]|uniref:glycosyltransferase family 2 protein n=1 Tax=Methylibium sp. TaxID=2067992 RepID=UPI003D11C720
MSNQTPAPPQRRRTERPRISVVLPAYNEAGNLPALLERLLPVLRRTAAAHEVIVVDDGSRDDTPLVLAPYVRRGAVMHLRLSRNFGKEIALSAGLDQAAGDVVCLMDADGQHPPELIPELLARWSDGADMVYTVRTRRDDEGPLKRLGSALFYRAIRSLSGVDMPRDAGDFRLLDRCVADALCNLPERNRYMKGLYAWVGFRSTAVPYTPDARSHGSSHYPMARLVRLAFDGLTAFTTLPLRVWSALGAGFALGALLYAVYLLVEHYIEGHPLPGWTTLAVGLMFFSGVQLISIGILGEYLGRVFEEVKRRPLYLVEERRGQGLTSTGSAGVRAA